MSVVVHCIGIVAVTAFLLLCTLLPFLPGRHDGLAVPLSMMAQAFGTVGLLLVPIGALWIASFYSNWLAGKRRALAIAALVLLSLFWAFIALVAFAQDDLSFAVVTLAAWSYVVVKVWRRLGDVAQSTTATARAIPYYLVVVPIALAVAQGAVADKAAEFGRQQAIANSERLRADIEQYRKANGQYPSSLMSLCKDYSPAVRGIEHYHYERYRDAYNLYFEQPTFRLGTQEIVMYNPRDQHAAIACHDMDILQMTPDALAVDRSRGYYASYDGPQQHWKYFWFD